jgi:hypothetical protein
MNFQRTIGGTPEENQAITNAVMSLEILRKDVAAWKLKHR